MPKRSKSQDPANMVVINGKIHITYCCGTIPSSVFEYDADKPLEEEMRRTASEFYGTVAKVKKLEFVSNHWVCEIDEDAEKIPMPPSGGYWDGTLID